MPALVERIPVPARKIPLVRPRALAIRSLALS